MSTMMSYRYLPYVTLPTRITQFSTTCIDHIFVKKSHKEKVLNTLCGMIYCDISDHLPCFISLQYANNTYAGNRPMTRIFGARNCSKFVQKMTTENWNDKYMDSEHDWYHKFVTTVHQIFQQSFPLVQLSRRRIKDKPWITKGLKLASCIRIDYIRHNYYAQVGNNWWNIISIKIFSADVWKKRRQIITKMFSIATKTLRIIYGKLWIP